MKRIIYGFNCLLCFGLISACDLLEDKDEFECEKNAPLNKGGKDLCAVAGITNYTQNENTPSESMTLNFVWGAGSFVINLNTSVIEAKTYTYPGEASLFFQGFNKNGSGELVITSIDRTARIMSGHYDMSAEGASNYQAYDYEVIGTFSKVSF